MYRPYSTLLSRCIFFHALYLTMLCQFAFMLYMLRVMLAFANAMNYVHLPVSCFLRMFLYDTSCLTSVVVCTYMQTLRSRSRSVFL